MEEKTVRKLPFILEVLIIAVIVFGFSLGTSMLLNPYMIQLIQASTWLITVINLVRGCLGPFLGGLVCFKLIEKQPIRVGGLLLISILYQLLALVPTAMVSNFVARFGSDVLTNYLQISGFVVPVIVAIVMTVVVRLLTAPKKKGAPALQIGLFAHVLLLLFTCGIWHLIWIYRTTGYLNGVPGEPYRNPGTKLLLCMLIPFYSIYWVYQSAQRIDKLAKSLDVTSDLAVVCLILEIFVPLIPPILMQDKINKIAATQTVEF